MTHTPPAGTILIVEDDERIQRTLERQFVAEGYAVRVISNGAEAVAAAVEVKPAAVVLDLMLPGMSGRDICKRLKSIAVDLPVIILSAISEVADKVLLLEMGADDYVTKPFSPRELLARVQAAIRRASRTAEAKAEGRGVLDTEFTFGDMTADFSRMEMHRAGEMVPLTAHEFKLLRFFIEHAERVIGREELLNHVWGYNAYPTTRTVDNQILKLRQKLEPDPARPIYFRTVHGAGYKFVRCP